jgi:phosphate-selective porin
MVMRRIAVTALFCALAAASAAAQQEPKANTPDGVWRVQFATPHGQRVVTMTMNVSGRTITGHVTDEYGEYPVDGRFAEGEVTASWSVPEQGKLLEITMKGRLEGDVINGTAKLGDAGEGALVARRTGDAG